MSSGESSGRDEDRERDAPLKTSCEELCDFEFSRVRLRRMKLDLNPDPVVSVRRTDARPNEVETAFVAPIRSLVEPSVRGIEFLQ